MPRGTRAVPVACAELHQTLHHRDDGHATFVSPAVPTLEVTCWCEAKVVKVAQWRVRLGVTESCGRCTPPPALAAFVVLVDQGDIGHAERYLTAVIARRRLASEWEKRRLMRAGYVSRPLPPAATRGRPRGAGSTRETVAERRDRVAQMWSAGKSRIEIAGALHIADLTVRNDLVNLRQRGVIR